MDIISVLVSGILIGWLIEWIIDWFYWRPARKKNETKETESRSAANVPAMQTTSDAQINNPVKKTMTARATKPKRIKIPAPPHADKLTAIKGVGPAIERQLNLKGIFTYEELSQLTEDELELAMGDLLERFFNQKTILQHAAELATKKRAA